MGTKIKNGSRDTTMPLLGTVHHPQAGTCAIINLHTNLNLLSWWPITKIWKAIQNVELGVVWMVRVTKGHRNVTNL